MGKHTAVPCKNCNGTGRITIHEKGKPKTITCGICGGSGRV